MIWGPRLRLGPAAAWCLAFVLVTMGLSQGAAQSLECAEIGESFRALLPYHLSQSSQVNRPDDLTLARSFVIETLLSLDPQQNFLTKKEVEGALPRTLAEAQTLFVSLGLDLNVLRLPPGFAEKRRTPSAPKLTALHSHSSPSRFPRAQADCRGVDPIYQLIKRAAQRNFTWFPSLATVAVSRSTPAPVAKAKPPYHFADDPRLHWPNDERELKEKFHLTLWQANRGMNSGLSPSARQRPPPDDTNSALSVALAQINRQRHSQRNLSPQQFYAYILKGLLRALDPHSDFLIGAQRARYRALYEPQGRRLPFRLIEDAAGLRFADLKGAAAAKLFSSDLLLAINGQEVINLSPAAAQEILQGSAANPSVQVTVRRQGRAQTIEVHLPPQSDSSPERLAVKLLDKKGGIYLIRIGHFYAGSARDLAVAMAGLLKPEKGAPDLRGLILDLRDNPGGTVSDALSAAGAFVDSGPLLRQRGFALGSNPTQFEDVIKYDNHPGVIFSGPITILVNRNTASAAEIFASALQEYRVGILIGAGDARTYGKWTVQTVVPHLSSMVKLTTHAYFSPQGRSFQNIGMPVDIVLPDLGENRPWKEQRSRHRFAEPPHITNRPKWVQAVQRTWQAQLETLEKSMLARGARGRPLVNKDPALEEATLVTGDWLALRQRAAQNQPRCNKRVL